MTLTRKEAPSDVPTLFVALHVYMPWSLSERFSSLRLFPCKRLKYIYIYCIYNRFKFMIGLLIDHTFCMRFLIYSMSTSAVHSDL